MDSRSETNSLVVLMTVIAGCYVLGRVVAEMLYPCTARGGLSIS